MRGITRCAFLLLLTLAALLGCGGADNKIRSAALESELQTIADSARTGQVRTVVISVETPKYSSFAASGNVAPDLEKKPSESSGIRIASISKLFTATTIVKLSEAGKLSLDDSIAKYLPADSITGLSLVDGKDLTATITIRQLLSHRSGLGDYQTDGEPGANGLTKFGEAQFAEPNRLWSLQDTIDWCRSNVKTFALPGAAYHYADTNFQLLGLIIEAVTKQPLYSAVRDLILSPVGIETTFEEFREPQFKNELIHYWFGDLDVTGVPALSSDYAGGGWISSTRDLTRFLEALVKGEIVSPANFEMMSSKLSRSAGLNVPGIGTVEIYYGLGIVTWEIPGIGRLVGHDGFFNSYAFYWVEKESFLVGSLNQSPEGADYNSIFISSISALKDLK